MSVLALLIASIRTALPFLLLPLGPSRLGILPRLVITLPFLLLALPTTLPLVSTTLAADPNAAPWLLVHESLFGLIFALLIRIVLAIGTFVGALFDAPLQPTPPVHAQWVQLLTLLLFVSLGGLALLVEASITSFITFPIALEPIVLHAPLQHITALLLLVLAIALPYLVAILLAELLLAVAQQQLPSSSLAATTRRLLSPLLLMGGIHLVARGLVDWLSEAIRFPT